MTQTDWIELLQLIPEDQHNQLIVMSQTGIELSIDLLLRTEPAYFVFRGRVCGNVDDGRVFFFPYNQITCVYLNRVVKEKEITDLFSDNSHSIETPLPGEAFDDNHQVEPVQLPAVTQNPTPILIPPMTANSSGPVQRPAPMPAIKLPPNVPAAALQPPAVNPRGSNPIIPALIPPVPAASNDASTPKGSILERLRAQRNKSR